MIQDEFIFMSKTIIIKYFKKYYNIELEEKDIFNVWHCKMLQNSKGIFKPKDDNKYIEVVYDGDKKRFYVDVYIKDSNKIVWFDEASDNYHT